MPQFRLPNNTNRTAIVGRTGSGKTLAGAWVLSTQNFDRQPWVIFDTKYDDTILNDIPRTNELGIDERIPRHAGIYLVHPHIDQTDKMERFLWRLWEHENVGLFVDEVYNLPNAGPLNRGAFAAILTQGRSKRIPTISLVQRPVLVTRFMMSEADYHMILQMNHADDKVAIRKFIHKDVEDLPKYWSHWHDVSEGYVHTMQPVPDRARLLETFDMRTRNIQRRGQWATKFISHGPSRIG